MKRSLNNSCFVIENNWQNIFNIFLKKKNVVLVKQTKKKRKIC